jgi:hypothetical protein
MNTATHRVEVPFPQAFAFPKRSPFPSAPRYGADVPIREDNRPLGVYGAPFGMIRPSLSLCIYSLTGVEKRKSRTPCTFSFIPGMNDQGFLKSLL